MNTLPFRSVAAASAIFLLLDLAWLAGGNAGWVPEGQRSLVKILSLMLAVIAFVVLTIRVARHAAARDWLQITVVTGALSVGLGLVLILLVGSVLYHDQFFHDGVRTLSLLTVLVGGTLGAGITAAIIGLIVRRTNM